MCLPCLVGEPPEFCEMVYGDQVEYLDQGGRVQRLSLHTDGRSDLKLDTLAPARLDYPAVEQSITLLAGRRPLAWRRMPWQNSMACDDLALGKQWRR